MDHALAVQMAQAYERLTHPTEYHRLGNSTLNRRGLGYDTSEVAILGKRHNYEKDASTSASSVL
jgi:hypothetical protein